MPRPNAYFAFTPGGFDSAGRQWPSAGAGGDRRAVRPNRSVSGVAEPDRFLPGRDLRPRLRHDPIDLLTPFFGGRRPWGRRRISFPDGDIGVRLPLPPRSIQRTEGTCTSESARSDSRRELASVWYPRFHRLKSPNRRISLVPASLPLFKRALGSLPESTADTFRLDH